MSDFSRTWVEVSKDALKHNVNIVRGLLRPDTKIMAVVKANAYGHGLVESGRLLARNGADWLAVFTLEDALALRTAKIKTPILVLGITAPVRFNAARAAHISLTICNAEYLSLIPPKLSVHVKVETGLFRQGVPLSELRNFFDRIPTTTHIEGIYSHLADAENLHDRSFTLQQISQFKQAIEIANMCGHAQLIAHL